MYKSYIESSAVSCLAYVYVKIYQTITLAFTQGAPKHTHFILTLFCFMPNFTGCLHHNLAVHDRTFKTDRTILTLEKSLKVLIFFVPQNFVFQKLFRVFSC